MKAKIDISVIDPIELEIFQISMAHIITDPVVVITGPNIFKYYKIEDRMRNFKEVHS